MGILLNGLKVNIGYFLQQTFWNPSALCNKSTLMIIAWNNEIYFVKKYASYRIKEQSVPVCFWKLRV